MLQKSEGRLVITKVLKVQIPGLKRLGMRLVNTKMQHHSYKNLNSNLKMLNS